MAPKGGTVFLLLIVACAAADKSSYMMSENRPGFKDMAKKLMRKCQEMGYPMPKMELMRTVFNNSGLSTEDRSFGQSNSFLSTFQNILDSVSYMKDSFSRFPMGDSDETTNQMLNCSYLPAMIDRIRNSSETSVCYFHAYMAPLSWETLTTESENNIDSGDYDTLLWAAKPALQEMPPARMKFPFKVSHQRVKKMMKMLMGAYESMSDNQRMHVGRWAKQQITQNNFNCTMRPSSDSRLKLVTQCKSSLQWLDPEALSMMGPYLSSLAPDDVDSAPSEKLCEFFQSAKLKSALKMVTKMNPSLAKRFLQRLQECSGEQFDDHIDKLGALACYYDSIPMLNNDLSRKLLSDLDRCDNPRIKKVKKQLVSSVMSNSNTTEALLELGSSVTLLSPKQLSEISAKDLKQVLKNLGPTARWTQGQLRTLVNKQLGDKKCKEVSSEELMALQSVAGGLPNCVLEHVKAREILNNSKALKNFSKQMKKGQLKALLKGLREDVDPSELVQKLQGALLRSISLTSLAKADITSLDQVEDKIWSLPQAAFLAKKMQDLKQLYYRKLRSVLQGVTCKMIEKVADSDLQDMAQTITETPKWLSKVLAGCAAQKLFASLENERTDYFKTITKEEMAKIPTVLLLHLPSLKVNNLPDSVCPMFLYKMEVADLSSLPLRAPSRLALTQRALRCLGNVTDLSGLTMEDVSRLGPLLCELQPSQLSSMAPDVLNSSLQEMASCQYIPQRHRADLIQLMTQTFGDPSGWSPKTMENLGPLLLLDDNATSALPNTPWMKDVLCFLRLRLSHISDTLKKLIFRLITTDTKSNPARKKRANDDTVPTVELIEELGEDNVLWTAAQLDQMSNNTFLTTVEILGNISDYKADQLAVLSKKAVEAFGSVSQMTESAVVQMGCITQGFSNADLEKLPFLLDALENIARCRWNESQMESVWKGVAEHNNLTVQQLGAAEMVSLSQFICGLNPSEIGQLNMDAFKEAVGSMNGIRCSIEVTQQLSSLSVSAFGKPSTWTEARVSDLGNIIAGLDATQMASLDPPVFSFISESCIPLIPPSNFAALSVAQLQALGPDNAALVTSAQRAALTDEQRAALEEATLGSRDQTKPYSGAPSLSVEGISAFMKPLLFLLTGFLLL